MDTGRNLKTLEKKCEKFSVLKFLRLSTFIDEVDIGLVGFNLGSSKGTFAIHCQFSSGQFLVHFFGVSGHRWPQNLRIADNKV